MAAKERAMPVMPDNSLQPGDAVIVVDVQIDFCPGGALPIEHGDDVIPACNLWADAAHRAGIPVYASRDWHPANHLSFRDRGGEWPPHCVQDTEGACFHDKLELPEGTILVTKGTRFDKDQYSAFDETGLADELRRQGVQRLWIGGLAQDVCVRATALEAAQEGFETHVLLDATRPVTPEGGREALREMEDSGVKVDR
jgi:nicotinamidase/pyrazinamidase